MKTGYNVIRLATDFYCIEEKSGDFLVRCFLLIGHDGALLIDTGIGGGDLRKVVEELTDLPIILINTHADPDHTGCNQLFERSFLHPAEFERFRKSKGTEPVLVPIWENDIINLGSGILEVVLIPGHTPGSIALLDRENKLLFAGDTVQNGTIYLNGEGRNLEAYLHSLDKLIGMRDLYDTVYCSHGDMTLDGDFVKSLAKSVRGIVLGKTQPLPKTDYSDFDIYDLGIAKLLYQPYAN